MLMTAENVNTGLPLRDPTSLRLQDNFYTSRFSLRDKSGFSTRIEIVASLVQSLMLIIVLFLLFAR